ncbi:hypothetical protein HGRIS_004363 [Hohenbuehelia grisea]|uniref:glutathione transferase n=1 Tax=Hohenbuehelia grisea TaxID=104357 RepID=A0ABR3JC03_9AGAR
MVLKLYGIPLSTCTRRVAVVAHEINAPFELVEVDFMKGEHKGPEFLKKQPFGQVPVLDDDGFIVYESRAISRYLANKYKSPLIPSDLKKNALFEQAASIEHSNFDPSASKAVFENVFKKWRGLEPDAAVFDGLIATLDEKLKVYDGILANQNFLGGDVSRSFYDRGARAYSFLQEITLADLFHLPYGSMLETAGSKVLYKYKNVERYARTATLIIVMED